MNYFIFWVLGWCLLFGGLMYFALFTMIPIGWVVILFFIGSFFLAAIGDKSNL